MPTVGVFAAIFDERGRILCVKRDYGDRSWTLPGGGVEPGESPLTAIEREVREETGYVVRAGALVGVYATPWKDDLALCFAATIRDREPWEANTEIAAVGFFARDDLPEPFSPRAKSRIADAFDGRTAVVHVFEEAGSAMVAQARVRFPPTVTSVGALVVRDRSLLVARMTYGPNRGRYMLPGGAVEPGELPEATVVREVREETGVEAHPRGVVGVLSTLFEEDTHTYLLWLMEPVAGDPTADGAEIDHCCFMSFDEVLRRDDVADLVKYLVARLRNGALAVHAPAVDFTHQVPGIPGKLFV